MAKRKSAHNQHNAVIGTVMHLWQTYGLEEAISYYNGLSLYLQNDTYADCKKNGIKWFVEFVNKVRERKHEMSSGK